MERVARGLMLVPLLFALASCKGKASSSGAEDANASASAPPAPSASAPSAPSLASLMGFEGEIDMTASSADSSKPPQPVDMLVKGDKVRIDVLPGSQPAVMLGNKSFLILRVADKKLDIVSDARRQIIDIDLTNPDTLKGLAKTGSIPGRPAKPEPPPKLAKTGNKETIAGYPCEDWEVTGARDGKKKASLCVADLPSTFFHIPLTGVPGEYGFALELVDGQHFPMRVVGYDDRTGAESGRVEVTKLDPHPTDAAKFELPAGYQTVDMMQMVQALSGGHMPGMPSAMPGMPTIPPHPRHGHH